ncbi:MAG: glycosyltransferase family 4 protein [Candidatus Helarchaeota archaeon]
MKIVSILEYLPPYQGSDRSIYELLNHLKGNIEVIYIIIPPLRTLWEFNKLSLESNRFLYFYKFTYTKNSEKYDNVMRIKLPKSILKLWKKNIAISFLITTIYNFLTLFKFLSKTKFDLVIINHPSPSSGLIGFTVVKLLNKPFIMAYPDLISDYAQNLIGTMSNGLINRILKQIERILLLKSPRIFTVTEYLKKYLLSIKIKKEIIKVISNGVDTTVFDANINGNEIRKKYKLQEKFVVIYVGHIEKWAGIEDIIDCAKKLENDYISFLIVGDGNLRPKFEKEHRKNVIFTGLQPYNEVPKFIAASDAAILTFPKTPTSYGASPLKLFEYMAMKKPVITTYIDGINEIIKNYKNGIVIQHNNINKLVKSILWLKDNPDETEKLGKNGYQTIKNKFTWEVLSNILKKFCVKYLNDIYYSK